MRGAPGEWGAIEVVGCHAEGEVGDVIVGGVAPPPGDTIWQQARWLAEDNKLRDLLLQEPRGGVFRHLNLVVPALHPRAAAGFIIMEPVHTPPMSGSNCMCVATVLLETGRIPMNEPTTRFILEAPGGLVEIVAECKGGKATRITLTNLPSFVGQLDAVLEVDGLGSVRVDTAYGGDTFVMVDAADLGVTLQPGEAADLAKLGMRLVTAATEQLGFDHPQNPDWSHISFCQIAGPITKRGGSLSMQNAVAIEPGKIDRSPTGTGVCARMAVLRARNLLGVGERLHVRSIIGSEFVGQVEADAMVGDRQAIVPSVSGRAWITGYHTYQVDPEDPWPTGYRLSDTWPSH